MSILLQEIIFILNNNPIITALCIFFINCGGKYILNDITEEHEKIFKSPIFRALTVASLLYISTRHILITIIFTLIYLFILDCLWNKHSVFCIFKHKAIEYIDDNIIDIINDENINEGFKENEELNTDNIKKTNNIRDIVIVNDNTF